MAGTHASSPTRYYGSQAVNTAFAEQTNRGTGSYQVVTLGWGADGGTEYFAAPCDGNLVRVGVTSVTTTDGSNKIGLTITNESNSDAAMVGTTLFDDSPVATADTEVACTLSTTAANVAVEQGDLIKVVYAETGTIAGVAVSFYFENV